jgi:restriction system protein
MSGVLNGESAALVCTRWRGGSTSIGFPCNEQRRQGWREVGPISAETSDEEIDDRFAKTYPDEGENTRHVWASQVRRYLREIRVGDGVITYDPGERAYLLGRIESDVQWNETEVRESGLPDGALYRGRTG